MIDILCLPGTEHSFFSVKMYLPDDFFFCKVLTVAQFFGRKK